MLKMITVLTLFFVSNAFAQKSTHRIYLGTNLTTTSLDLARTNNFTSVKNPKYGFNAGYKYVIPLSKLISIAAGLEFATISSKFSRPQYDNSPVIISPPNSVYEHNRITRLLIPVEGFYSLIRKEKFDVYLLAGVGAIVLNNVKRTVDYSIPSPPTGYIQATYQANQKIKFNNDNQFGFNILGGVGCQAKIFKQSFQFELSYCGDLSKSKFLSLHNIEDDSYFYSKFKSFQLGVAYPFSFKQKK